MTLYKRSLVLPGFGIGAIIAQNDATGNYLKPFYSGLIGF